MQGRLSKEINVTFLSLIPKIFYSLELRDFGPISFEECVYKNVVNSILLQSERFGFGKIQKGRPLQKIPVPISAIFGSFSPVLAGIGPNMFLLFLFLFL